MGKTTPTLDQATRIQHINAWQISGQSVAAYCRQAGIKVWIFRYWQRRLKEKSPKTEASAAGFIAIDAPDAHPEASAFACIRLCDGRELIFHQEVSAAYLRSVLGW